jgi:GT2 family glycosyltransferase
MQSIDLSIIIINYKTLSITKACLETIFTSDDSLNKEIIVIDNASNDASAKELVKAFPAITLIENATNKGFGLANNEGANKARGEYVLFLNSDTLLKKDTLELLYRDIARNSALVATCRLLNPDGTIQPQGGALPTLASLLLWASGIDDLPLINTVFTSYQHRNKHFFTRDQIMGWVGGTALVIQRDLFQEIGEFDPHIFMYGEDVELCMRLKKAGKEIHYFASPSLTHLGQASSSSKTSLVGEFVGLKYAIAKHYSGTTKTVYLTILRFAARIRSIIFGIVGDRKRQKIYEEILSLV